MSQSAEIRPIRGRGGRQSAQPVPLDGGDEMFPLRSAKATAERLGCSPTEVLRMWHDGRLRYVELPPPKRASQTLDSRPSRRWRTRNDYLIEDVRAWTHE